MILYILISCCFITIFSFHIPSGNCPNSLLITEFINRKVGNSVFHKSDLNLINEDEEFEGVIGYEAAEKLKERLPSSLQNLSQKLIRSLFHHDLNVINKKSSNYKPKWEIRDAKNRFDTCYYSIGEKILGRVSKVFPTYALVDIGCTKYGVLHARDMSRGWVDRVDLTLTPKEDIHVYVKSINNEYDTITLSLIPPEDRNGTGDGTGQSEQIKEDERKSIIDYQIEDTVEGTIVRVSPLGFYVDIGATVDAFLHISDIKLTDKSRKSYAGRIYKDRNKYKLGAKLHPLYIKSIDIIKNRIGLTENTLFEELERNVMTGRETPEQQSSYLRSYNLDFMKQLRVNDIESLKYIGGYDEYLKRVKANRNSSIDYLLYLDNLKEQEELENIQKNLFQDLSTKQKIKKDQERFNRLAHRLIDLNNSAFPPTEDEKSIYKYGDSKTWNSNIYTQFIPSSESQEASMDNERPGTKSVEEEGERRKVNKKYFRTLAEEITDGLRDVQGENFDFSQKYEQINRYDQPYKLINYLYDQFHKRPSNISVQKDKYEYERQYVQGSQADEFNIPNGESVGEEDLFLERDPALWKERLEMKERQMKRRDRIINELLNSKDSDEVELGQLVLETKDFDPFEHCNTLNESEASCFKGASRLFQDDVSKWDDRARRLILDNKIELPQISDYEEEELGHSMGKLGNETLDDDLEDIDPDILKALDENDDGDFTSPQIEDYIDGNPVKEEYMEDIDANSTGDYKEYPDIEPDEQDLYVDENDEYSEDDNLTDEGPLNNIPCDENDINYESFVKSNHYKSFDNIVNGDKYGSNGSLNQNVGVNSRGRREKFNVQKLITRLKKDKKLEKWFTSNDSPLTKLVSQPKDSGPNSGASSEDHIDNNVMSIIKQLKTVVHKITDTSFTRSLYDDTNTSSGHRPSSTNTSSTNVTATNINNDRIEEHSETNNSSDIEESLESTDFGRRALEMYALKKLEERQQNDDDHDGGVLKDLLSNKKDFKMLVKYAKEHLTPNDLEAIPKLFGGNNAYEEERLAKILRSAYGREEKKTNYTYYEEGIDKFLERQAEADKDPGRIASYKQEMNVKLKILLGNRNFINMLKRLKVDPKALNSGNITRLLPQQFHYQRLTPSIKSNE